MPPIRDRTTSKPLRSSRGRPSPGREPEHAATATPAQPGRRAALMILLAVVLLAAALRLWRIGEAPPGLNQDEAANAWNSWCLLKTGHDQNGQTWPVFYFRQNGSNASTLYLYFLAPFQAIGGLNEITTRLPASLAGVAAVLAIYYVGARFFGRRTGLIAAFLLATTPWAVHLGRWGIEGSICPLLAILPLCLLLSSGLIDQARPGPRPLVAALAGAVSGVCCYGYWPIRVFIPLMLLAVAVLSWRTWTAHLRSTRGKLALAVLVASFAATFGPLAWQHLTDHDPNGINRRGIMLQEKGQQIAETDAVRQEAVRYLNHFSPAFLFVKGGFSDVEGVTGWGQFAWYDLAFMLAGLAWCIRMCRRSAAARIVLALVLLYPVGDVLSFSPGDVGAHPLRSAPGLCGMVLLSAVGAEFLIALILRRMSRQSAKGILALLAAPVILLNVMFLDVLFNQYNNRESVHQRFMVDLKEACEWVRPRLDQYEAVFVTTEGMNLPYLPSLVHLRYDPGRWFRDKRVFLTPGEFDLCLQYGKMHFIYGGLHPNDLEVIKAPGRHRVLMVVRPGQYKASDSPLKTIDFRGEPVLMIYEQEFSNPA